LKEIAFAAFTFTPSCNYAFTYTAEIVNADTTTSALPAFLNVDSANRKVQVLTTTADPNIGFYTIRVTATLDDDTS